jgi:hypothetical protein
MPILSEQDEFEYLQNLPIGETVGEPSFFETFGSAFDFVMDEELSISSILNRQGYEDRRKKVSVLAGEGLDLSPYTDITGQIDYGRISAETGLVKSNLELYTERNEILKKRREANADVQERGSGLAQFLGSMAGYMLDPVNVATMPIGVGTAYKGMSILSRALMTGRNTAGIAIASESLIQPLVYQHKHDIESPYEFKDALIAIGTTAVGAGLIGSGMGGIAGYMTRLAEKSRAFVGFTPISEALEDINLRTAEIVATPNPSKALTLELNNLVGRKARIIEQDIRQRKWSKDQDMPKSAEQESIDILALMGSQLAEQKASMAPRVEDLLLKEYDNWVKNFESVEELNDWRTKAQKTLRAEINQVSQNNETWVRRIASEGGLNKARWAEEGFDVADMNALGKGTKPMFRKNGGMAPQDVSERFREQGMDMDDNMALNFIDDIVRNPLKVVDETQDQYLKELDAKFWELDDIANDYDALRALHRNTVESNVEKDLNILAMMDERRVAMDQPTRTYEDYATFENPAPARQTTSDLQRHLLDKDGLSEAFDRDMVAYNQLEFKKIVEIGEDGKPYFKDADSEMKILEDNLEGIESVRVCAIG